MKSRRLYWQLCDLFRDCFNRADGPDGVQCLPVRTYSRDYKSGQVRERSDDTTLRLLLRRLFSELTATLVVVPLPGQLAMVHGAPEAEGVVACRICNTARPSKGTASAAAAATPRTFDGHGSADVDSASVPSAADAKSAATEFIQLGGAVGFVALWQSRKHGASTRAHADGHG